MYLREVGVTKKMFPDIVSETMEYRLLAVNTIRITEEIVPDILEEAY